MGILDEFYTRDELCRRWNVSDDTIRRLTARGVLDSVDLPGRRSGVYRKTAIEALEAQYRGPAKGHRRAINADDAVREAARQRETWDEFRRNVSPVDDLYAALEKAVAVKLASDATFMPDDLEDYIALKRDEYRQVVEHVVKQAAESTGAPELRRMVGEGR